MEDKQVKVIKPNEESLKIDPVSNLKFDKFT